MIFFKHASEAKANTVDKVSWKRKFAIFPKCVMMNEANNTKMYVWLEFYEVRLYWEEGHGWWREYRLPEAQNFWKEDANSYDM